MTARCCLFCAAPLARRRKESVERFAARRFCNVACRGGHLGKTIAQSPGAGADRDALPGALIEWPAWARFSDITSSERLLLARLFPRRTADTAPRLPALTVPPLHWHATMQRLDAIYYAANPPEPPHD